MQSFSCVWFSLTKQVCFSKVLLRHAYSTSPPCILTAFIFRLILQKSYIASTPFITELVHEIMRSLATMKLSKKDILEICTTSVLKQVLQGGPKHEPKNKTYIFTAHLFLPSRLLCSSPLRDLAQACSLSALQSCSLTSDGSVLKRSSSTTRPLLFSSRHSLSSTGRHSRRFPLSSSCVNPVSSPKRDGSVCRQLFPRFRVRSFLHLNSSGGKVSI